MCIMMHIYDADARRLLSLDVRVSVRVIGPIVTVRKNLAIELSINKFKSDMAKNNATETPLFNCRFKISRVGLVTG